VHTTIPYIMVQPSGPATSILNWLQLALHFTNIQHSGPIFLSKESRPPVLATSPHTHIT
jgi:hypothetical protein